MKSKIKVAGGLAVWWRWHPPKRRKPISLHVRKQKGWFELLLLWQNPCHKPLLGRIVYCASGSQVSVHSLGSINSRPVMRQYITTMGTDKAVAACILAVKKQRVRNEWEPCLIFKSMPSFVSWSVHCFVFQVRVGWAPIYNVAEDDPEPIFLCLPFLVLG